MAATLYKTVGQKGTEERHLSIKVMSFSCAVTNQTRLLRTNRNIELHVGQIYLAINMMVSLLQQVMLCDSLNKISTNFANSGFTAAAVFPLYPVQSMRYFILHIYGFQLVFRGENRSLFSPRFVAGQG